MARPEPSPSVRDGRYLGENGLWWLDLRVDLTDCRAITSTSIRSGRPARQVSGHRPRTFDPSAHRPMVWTGKGTVGRRITRCPAAPLGADRLEGNCTSGSLGWRAASIRRGRGEGHAGSGRGELRTLGIEIEIERGVKPPDPIVDGPPSSTWPLACAGH